MARLQTLVLGHHNISKIEVLKGFMEKLIHESKSTYLI